MNTTKHLQELKRIASKKKNITLFIVIFLVVFIILRTLPHIRLLWQFAHLKNISLIRFLEVFYEKTIASLFLSTASSNIIAFALPFLVALNIVLIIEYYQKQKILLEGKSFFVSFGGMFLGLFGVGCFACSGLLLAPLISLLGLTAFFKILPYGGQELAYVGLIFIIASNIYLIKKISSPNVCNR